MQSHNLFMELPRNGCRAHAQRRTLELGSSCSWTLRQEGAIQSGNSISAERLHVPASQR
ncbi:unnamed protein product [Lepidochelys kempii]